MHEVGIQDRLERNTSGGWAWIGHLDGIADSEVTFIVEGPKVSGVVTLPGRLYHVRHIENELHVVREIDPSAFPDSLRPLLSDEAAVQALAANRLAEEDSVFDLVNQERAIHGLHLLSWDDRLFAAARAHSEDMAANEYFDTDGDVDASDLEKFTADFGKSRLPLTLTSYLLG